MNFYPIFAIEARWGGLFETPADIGAKLSAMTRKLEAVAPTKTHWKLLDGPEYEVFPLDKATSDQVTAAVERNATRAEGEEPDPDDGYTLVVIGSDAADGPVAGDDLHLSARLGSKSANFVTFQVGDIRRPNNFDLVTYPVYKAALEGLAELWPCPWAFAYTHDPAGRAPKKPFETAWMAYLSAPLAQELSPPPDLVAERTPGGGLLLSAVEGVIDPADPDQLRRSLALTGIMNDRVGAAGLPGAFPLKPARQGAF